MNIPKNKMPAAKLVRSATTTSGEKPCVMASFPKTGAMPKNTAELNAAIMPTFFLLLKDANLYYKYAIVRAMPEAIPNLIRDCLPLRTHIWA